MDADIDEAEDLLGKYVDDLQSNLHVAGDAIIGVSHYVTGYTGFSGDPDEQEGNYIALHAAADTGATITVELIGGASGPKELDADGIVIIRLNDHSQVVQVRATKSGVTETINYSLSGVVKETE